MSSHRGSSAELLIDRAHLFFEDELPKLLVQLVQRAVPRDRQRHPAERLGRHTTTVVEVHEVDDAQHQAGLSWHLLARQLVPVLIDGHHDGARPAPAAAGPRQPTRALPCEATRARTNPNAVVLPELSATRACVQIRLAGCRSITPLRQEGVSRTRGRCAHADLSQSAGQTGVEEGPRGRPVRGSFLLLRDSRSGPGAATNPGSTVTTAADASRHQNGAGNGATCRATASRGRFVPVSRLDEGPGNTAALARGQGIYDLTATTLIRDTTNAEGQYATSASMLTRCSS